MEENILIKSELNKTYMLFLKFIFIVPIVMMIIAFATQEPFDFTWFPGWLFLGSVILLIVAFVVFFALNSCSMTITDKRVYGKASFGQRVDLPLDMISSASTGLFSSVGVSTASGRIVFWLLGNQQEIFSAITNLLLERQTNKSSNVNNLNSNADELKKYKELLDSGIITQEEFDQKKKQLLGL